jgi:death-on-curing protein
MTFGGEDLYPTIVEKAAILGYLITVDQPFIDGNKRTGYAALEVFLVTNGYELAGTVDDKEQVMLAVAAHRMSREEFTAWVRTAVFPRQVRREHQA